jgi:hypothetical protein
MRWVLNMKAAVTMMVGALVAGAALAQSASPSSATAARYHQ